MTTMSTIVSRKGVRPFSLKGELRLKWLPSLRKSYSGSSSSIKSSIVIEIANLQSTGIDIKSMPNDSINDLQHRFQLLASKWKNETLFESSPWRITANASYVKIILLGKQVVPLILAELKKEERLWFEALRVITGKQPIPKEHAGDIEAMTGDWLKWGRDHGYEC